MNGIDDAMHRMRMSTGAWVVYSDFAPDSVTRGLSEHDLDEVLGAVQIITDQAIAHPHAEAIDPLPPYSSYWRLRLSLWCDIAGLPWLLLSQELDGGRIKQTMVACVDLDAATAAFEWELAAWVRSGKHHSITRSPQASASASTNASTHQWP